MLLGIFFSGKSFLQFYLASSLVLIPKVDNPSSFDKFRPISLCSVIYKICSKILVQRLTPIFSRLISPKQGAFLPGRSIFDNISLLQEMVNSINSKARNGNVLMKVDMAKAYDSVEWDFLLHVMEAFGFSLQVCNLIRNCISSPWFSVIMNGVSKGFFKGGRCLRQGDLLSPLLFILVDEVLSRLLKQDFGEGKIEPFSHPRGVPLISHLLYSNDIVIFSNGSLKSLRNIVRIFLSL